MGKIELITIISSVQNLQMFVGNLQLPVPPPVPSFLTYDADDFLHRILLMSTNVRAYTGILLEIKIRCQI